MGTRSAGSLNCRIAKVLPILQAERVNFGIPKMAGLRGPGA